MATYSQYLLFERFRRLLPKNIIKRNEKLQARDTIATVMKQFCNPIPVIQGLMPQDTANPSVFRMIMTDIIDSPAISCGMSVQVLISRESTCRNREKALL